MSAPENEPTSTTAKVDRSIRISALFWSVVIAVILVFAAWNWVTLAVDGGGSFGTWAWAIALTVVAVAGAVYLWSALRLMRRFTASQDGRPDSRD